MDRERTTGDLRVGYLLRLSGYLQVAIISMWTQNPRVSIMMGMAEASLRGEGPDDSDGDLLERLRGLVAEAREFHADGDFPAAMARMRVAQDLVDMRIVAISGG
jgi:hypothetical protein